MIALPQAIYDNGNSDKEYLDVTSAIMLLPSQREKLSHQSARISASLILYLVLVTVSTKWASTVLSDSRRGTNNRGMVLYIFRKSPYEGH